MPITPWHIHLIVVLLLWTAGGAIYSNVIDAPFVYDDVKQLEENPRIRVTEFDAQSLYAVAASSLSNRPVGFVTFALNYYFHRNNPAGYRVANIVIHLTNGVIVYWLVYLVFSRFARQTGREGPYSLRSPTLPVFMAFFAALVFVVHPVQIQAVTYVVQRFTSLATLFYLLAFLLYLVGRMESGTWRRWGLWVVAFLSWLASLLCKEIAATLPIAILLFEWYFFQDLRLDWLQRNGKYLFVVVVVLIALAVFYFDGNPLQKIHDGYAAAAFTLWERVLTQFRVVVFYISLVFYPAPSRLNLLHEFTISESWIEPVTTLLSFGAIAVLLGISLYTAKRWRVFSFGIVWFFVHLAIESSVIALEIIYEHRLYLPMFGVVLLVSDLVFRGLSGRSQSLLLVACCAIVLSLAVATYVRNAVWRDPVRLWSDVATKNPRSIVAHNDLGNALKKRGDLQEAIRHYRQALNLESAWLTSQNRILLLNNLARTLAALGDHDAAVALLQDAVREEPAYALARHNLGTLLLELGRAEEAVVQLQVALRLRPHYLKARNNLGNAYAELGRTEQALRHLSVAVEQAPGADTHFNLANAFVRSGNLVEAEKNYLHSLQHDPSDADARQRLAHVLVRQQRLDAAVEQMHELLRLYPERVDAHLLKGAIHVEQGNLTKACDHFGEVLRLDPKHEQKRRLERSCQERLPVPARR